MVRVAPGTPAPWGDDLNADITSVEALAQSAYDLAAAGGGGGTPEMRVADGYIQWRVVGSPTWNNLISTASLAGPAGSITDIPVYTSLASLESDIASEVLVDGDIVFLET